MSPTTVPHAKAILLGLLPVLGLAGCSESTDPNDGGGNGGPQSVTVYDLSIQLRFIEVLGSCDPDDIFGNPTNGEFQYRIVVSGEGQSHTRETSGYGTFLGVNVPRMAGEQISIPTTIYNWNDLPEGALVTVEFRASEWDGLGRDPRMIDEHSTRMEGVLLGGRLSSSVAVGSSLSCLLNLQYYVTWTPQEVES